MIFKITLKQFSIYFSKLTTLFFKVWGKSFLFFTAFLKDQSFMVQNQFIYLFIFNAILRSERKVTNQIPDVDVGKPGGV